MKHSWIFTLKVFRKIYFAMMLILMNSTRPSSVGNGVLSKFCFDKGLVKSHLYCHHVLLSVLVKVFDKYLIGKYITQ